MVEFALILPLMLFIIIGGLQLGLAMVWRLEVTHVAQQSAIVASRDGCPAGLEAVPQLLGREPSESSCSAPLGPEQSQGRPHSDHYALTVSDQVPMSTPWWPVFTVSATGRAVP